MSHGTPVVSETQHPSKGFRTGVGGVDDAGDVLQDQPSLRAPFLYSEQLNIDVSRTWGRLVWLTILMAESLSSYNSVGPS